MMDPSAIPAIVLAAGLSRRMGRENKLLLPYGKGTVLGAVLQQITALDWAGIYVVTGHENDLVSEVLRSYEVEALYHPDFARGQGSSIRAGRAALPPDAPAFMIALGDLPLLRTADYVALRSACVRAFQRDERAILRPLRQGQPGHPVFFAAAHRPALLASQDPTGARAVIKSQRAHLHPFSTTSEAFFYDVDTPEAYRNLPPPG